MFSFGPPLLPSACDTQRRKTEREIRKLLLGRGRGKGRGRGRTQNSDKTTAKKCCSLQYILLCRLHYVKKSGFNTNTYGTYGSLQK
jgi:hypothetical protein